MSIKLLFEDIADAIREKSGSSDTYTPAEMPSAIRSIPSGSSTASGVSYDNTSSGLTASNVQDAIDELSGDVSTINSDLSELRSHVGLIIHSTTLDTEAKVKAIYGGTTWIQHTGYVLRGADSGVTADNAVKDGGNDDAIVPYHRHGIPKLSGTAASNGNHHHAFNVYMGEGAGQVAAVNYQWRAVNPGGMSTTDAGAHTHSVTTNASNTDYVGTEGNTTNANIPNYKSVYIWERTA